jgi:hypothetical protein
MTERELAAVRAKLADRDAEIRALTAEIKHLRTRLRTDRETHEYQLQGVAEELKEWS